MKLQITSEVNNYLCIDNTISENDLYTFKKAIANNNNGAAPGDPSFAGRDGLNDWMRSTPIAAYAIPAYAVIRPVRTAGGVGSSGASAVFWIVVNEHIFGVRQKIRLDIWSRTNCYLETAHVSRISGVFEAILIAFQETFYVITEVYML